MKSEEPPETYIDTFKEYADLAGRTDNERASPVRMVYHTMKIAEEAGEVAGLIAKWAGQGHNFEPEKLKAELGDVLWHITRLAECVGYSLGHVAGANIEKLRKRYPHGFSTDDSINRKE